MTKHNITIDDHIWLLRGEFLKQSKITVTVFMRLVRDGDIQKKGASPHPLYKYEPAKHYAGKPDSKKLIDEGFEKDRQIGEANKRSPTGTFGQMTQENMAWLMEYAHDRRMTVSETLGKMINLTRAWLDLKP